MDDGTVFAPNDFYPLKKETFRLYYTSESTDQQAIDVTVYDSFGQRFDLSFSFQNDSDKENEEASLWRDGWLGTVQSCSFILYGAGMN